MIRTVWRPIATVTVLVATVAGFIYYFVSHPLVRHQLRETSLLTLVTIFILYLGVVISLSLVTATTLRLCKVRLEPRESALLTMYAAVINFFGPLQSGPAFRAVYLKRKHGLQLKQYTAATLIYYALYALFSGIFLLFTVAGWWLLAGGLILVIAAFLLRSNQSSVAKRLRELNLRAIYALALATFLQVSLVAVIYFVELRSITPSVHVSQAIVYTGAANFSLFVSLTPGAIGFRESFLLF
jgi:uncharacterized membrane protein YbhN (UPF0104 family)